MKQSLADSFIFAPCGRPLQASQGATAMQSIKDFSYSGTGYDISKCAFWSIDHLIESISGVKRSTDVYVAIIGTCLLLVLLYGSIHIGRGCMMKCPSYGKRTWHKKVLSR